MAEFILIEMELVISTEEFIIMSDCIQIFQVLADWGLVLAAFYGVMQWKNIMRSKDQYSALLNIRRSFTQFKKIFQDKRISMLRLPIKSDNDQYEHFKLLGKKYERQLWREYNKIDNAIELYIAVSNNTENCLTDQLSRVRYLITSFLAGWDIYFEQITSTKKHHEVTLEESKKYIMKSSTENDEVSKELFALITTVFNKTSNIIDSL